MAIKQDIPLAVDESPEELVDFSVMKKYEPVPQNEPFLCVVTKWNKGKSSKGMGKISVELTVEENRFKSEDHVGRIMSRDFSLQPQSLFSIFNLMVSLGADPEELKIKGSKMEESDFLGLSCVAYAQDNTYNDNTRSQIRRTLPASKWEEAKKVQEEGPAEGEEEEGSNF